MTSVRFHTAAWLGEDEHLVPDDVLAGLELRRDSDCVDRVRRVQPVRGRPLAVSGLPSFVDLEPDRTSSRKC